MAAAGKRPLADRVDEILDGVHPSFIELIDKKKLKGILAEIDAEMKSTTKSIAPPFQSVFEAFRYCSVDDLVAVIIGQDPYPNEAMGLCFGTLRGVKVQQSFARIRECLKLCGHMCERKDQHADLRPWAVQRILLINAAFTTVQGEIGKHLDKWQAFTKSLIEKICERRKKNPVCFVLWGGFAQKLVKPTAKKYDQTIFEWSHPSPMGDNSQPESRKFKNCTNFDQVNIFLKAKNRPVIVWDNMASVTAFTDGACNANGKPEAHAGFGGVIVGGQFQRTMFSGAVLPFEYQFADEQNVEKGFIIDETKSMRPSNQRAELLAICWTALTLIRGFALGYIVIFSDSQYSVKSLNKWLAGWRRKGNESSHSNMDLINIADSLLTFLRTRALSVSLRECRASHDTPFPQNGTSLQKLIWRGNDAADKLAVRAKDNDAPPFAIQSPLPLSAET